jgi:hypothetical protein
MKKKQLKPKKAGPLILNKQTLRVLGGPELQEVVGRMRIHIPVGYAPDTTPIYGDGDDTTAF